MCTGNISTTACSPMPTPVYPCVYREHFIFPANTKSGHGLSLCVQGTSINRNSYIGIGRFIPVCTGNIKRHYYRVASVPVYPCVYREHVVTRNFIINYPGLSLCVQGTSPRNRNDLSLVRFIPVCTGNIPIITYCFIIKILT